MTTTATNTTNTTVADAWRILDKLIKSKSGHRARADQLCQQKHEQSLADYHVSTIYSDEDKIAYYRELVGALLGITRPDQPTPMNPTETAIAPSAQSGTAAASFEALCKLIQSAGGDMHKRVAQSLRHALGRSVALAVYHNDKTVPDAQKLELYAKLIEAVKAKDFAKLDGRVDVLEIAGKTPLPSPETEKAVPAVKPEPPKESTRAESTSAPTLPSPAVDVKPAATPLLEPLADILTRLIDQRIQAALVSFTPPASAPSAEHIKGVVKEALNNGSFPTERVQSIVTATMASDLKQLVRDEVRSYLVQLTQVAK